MYGLLFIREQARAHGTPPQCAAIDRERFGASFGSSVGSLISLPLDLYFTDAAPPPAFEPGVAADYLFVSANGVGLALLWSEVVDSRASGLARADDPPLLELPGESRGPSSGSPEVIVARAGRKARLPVDWLLRVGHGEPAVFHR